MIFCIKNYQNIFIHFLLEECNVKLLRWRAVNLFSAKDLKENKITFFKIM